LLAGWVCALVGLAGWAGWLDCLLPGLERWLGWLTGLAGPGWDGLRAGWDG